MSDHATKEDQALQAGHSLGMFEDWTLDDTGHSNSSPEFLLLVEEVARLIRGEAHALINGDVEGAARLIMAQLAHVHGLRPASSSDELRAALDVDRLARAMLLAFTHGNPATKGTPRREWQDAHSLEDARAVAAEYAALSSKPSAEPE